MSREILFRAIVDSNTETDKNGQWVEGYYDRMVIGGNERHYIHVYDSKMYRVDPKTVSQKLTLIDKNGNTFFDGWEGDRIRAYSICNKHPFEEYNNTEKYTEGVIKWSVNCFALVTDDNLVIDGWINAEKVEVIGNIHDDIGEVE